MGNRCVEGNAPLECSAAAGYIVSHTLDNGDGTYTMTWRTERAVSWTTAGSILSIRLLLLLLLLYLLLLLLFPSFVPHTLRCPSLPHSSSFRSLPHSLFFLLTPSSAPPTLSFSGTAHSLGFNWGRGPARLPIYD